MWKAIRANITVGLILVTPLVITAFVANWLFRLVTNQFLGLFPRAYRDAELDFLLRIASLVVVLIVLFLIGVLVRNIVGRRIYQLGDRILARIPVVNRIYIASRQVIDAFITQRETVFNQVVLVQYPRKGIYAMGFLTASAPYSFRSFIPQGRPGDEFVAVFIPTTPNPTSGWLCYVPREDVTPIPYTSGDAMKLIISAGVVYPGESGAPPPPSLVDKLHHLFRRDAGVKDAGTKPPEPEPGPVTPPPPESPAP
ncbi:MAG TPA: DUF502 domain-containing protein [Kiritimatiellia bacterium]|nr:DUF502 domain-containing protein [Kiritimatiellia bacterium]HMO98878.1 DUF502 domain-containing protein [Kiritimatiellia bacterium]HMP97630.1 DUF502 domain-containing protein [Kiritimatiellia bacterium]